jgi:hypothetical protein
MRAELVAKLEADAGRSRAAVDRVFMLRLAESLRDGSATSPLFGVAARGLGILLRCSAEPILRVSRIVPCG